MPAASAVLLAIMSGAASQEIVCFFVADKHDQSAHAMQNAPGTQSQLFKDPTERNIIFHDALQLFLRRLATLRPICSVGSQPECQEYVENWTWLVR